MATDKPKPTFEYQPAGDRKYRLVVNGVPQGTYRDVDRDFMDQLMRKLRGEK